MRFQALAILLLPALLGQAPAVDSGDPAAKALRDRLREIYLAEASGYTIYRDSSRKEKVELRHEPVYVWTNPIATSGQDGHVFVWRCRGRAEVIGTIFSTPHSGPRRLIHELHSLSTSVLDVDRDSPNGWKPLQPGIEPKPIPEAPAPARSATQRLAQMKALGREFAASGVDYQGKRWELRLLPQPLYRFESTDPDVLDGAVFAMVSSAGTDPELILVLEARKPGGDSTASPIWHFGVARFSDQALTVKLKNQVVYTAPLLPYSSNGTPTADPTYRYRLFVDRTIPPVEDMDSTSTPKKPGPKP
jgi:hypothetical protein